MTIPNSTRYFLFLAGALGFAVAFVALCQAAERPTLLAFRPPAEVHEVTPPLTPPAPPPEFRKVKPPPEIRLEKPPRDIMKEMKPPHTIKKVTPPDLAVMKGPVTIGSRHMWFYIKNLGSFPFKLGCDALIDIYVHLKNGKSWNCHIDTFSIPKLKPGEMKAFFVNIPDDCTIPNGVYPEDISKWEVCITIFNCPEDGDSSNNKQCFTVPSK